MRAGVVDDVLPLARVGPGHHRNHRIGVAQVEDFVGNAGLDEDEIARSIVHGDAGGC